MSLIPTAGRLALLAVALAAPLAAQDFEAEALYGTARLEAGFDPDPFAVEVVAGGATPNPIAGPECVGYIEAAQPDVALDYRANATDDLALYVESDGDTALLVRTPAGRWLCSDDADGVNPRLDLRRPASGVYSVWVASYDASSVDATFFATDWNRDSMVVAMPDAEGVPLYGDLRLQSGFTPDPNQVGVIAGGPTPNPVPGCVGYLAAGQPDVRVTYVAGAAWDLAMAVESADSTALLVRTPTGDWRCAAFADGVAPRLAFASPPSGAYHVWIASTSPTAAAEATLNVTESPRAAPAPNHEAAPRFGRLALGAGPAELAVEAGGAPADPITAFGCVGYLASDRPDAVVDVATAGDVRFAVRSATDAALLVRAPDGTWLCDDDTDGRAPEVALAGAPGAYAVWIAAFGGDASPAVLGVSEAR